MNAGPTEKVPTEQSARSRMNIPEWLCLGHWLPWLVLVMGLMVTFLLWRHEQQIAAEELKAHFEFRVRRATTLIKQRMIAYEQVMHGVQGLFAASGVVGRTQFREYVAALQLGTNYPGIQGVSFALNVPLAQKAAHIAAIRAEGFPDYRIMPEGQRENYMPVIYLEPFSGSNSRVFGYDTYTEPVRRAALDRARETGKASLSGKIRLVQETGERAQAGVLMYLPVYKNGIPHNTPASRRANLFGMVAASFRMDDLMASLHGGRDNELDIEIYDGTEVSGSTLLHDYDGIRFAGTLNAPLQSLTNLEISDHTWLMAIRPLAGFETRLASNKPQIIAIAGTLLTLLMTLLTCQLASSRARAMEAAREMNRELIESEKRYRTVADFASNWEYWRAPDGSFRYVSPSCVQICGYSREDFYRDPLLMMKIIHPVDVPLFNTHIHTNSKSGSPRSIEFRIITRDGQQRWIAHVCRPVFDDDGTPLGQRASNRDITEQRQTEEELRLSEERYRRLYNDTPVMLHSIDHDGRLVSVSNYWLETLGYERNEVLGRISTEFHTAASRSYATGVVLPEFFRTGSCKEVPYQIVKKNGEILDVHLSAIAERDSEEKIVRSLAVMVDVTEQKQAEAALHEQATLLKAEVAERRRAQEALTVKQLQLEELNRSLESRITESVAELRKNDQIMILKCRQAAMGEMIHNISHQWRQPLNTLGMVIQNMCYEFDAGQITPEKMACYTEQVMELICFMSQTIDDFTRFFREDHETVCFSVKESIRRATSLVSATLKDHGIALIVEQDEEVQINGQPNEYAQVLLNLLSNAKDVLLERAVTLPVITIKVFRQSERAVVTIGDNAGGIPDDIIDRVFDHSFTTKAEGKGSGIGLYMSRTIIEKHMGGRLTVSNVGGGAEFRVEVEAAQPGS